MTKNTIYSLLSLNATIHFDNIISSRKFRHRNSRREKIGESYLGIMIKLVKGYW